jgi:hypothetical protein
LQITFDDFIQWFLRIGLDLKEIGSKAFYNCVIDSIVLTIFVENIRQSSFCGCQAL